MPGDLNFLILNSIPNESIRNITVQTITGQKLLQRLFNDKCPIPIQIQPDVFPETQQQSTKRSLSDFLYQTLLEYQNLHTTHNRLKKFRVEIIKNLVA